VSKVHLLSLGCPKNLVDSEKLLRRLSSEGMFLSSDPEDADILMVNTCGFIEAAKRESVEEILKAAALKTKSGKKKLIVYGCLAKRSGEELLKEVPEIDALWGVGEDEKIVEYCRKAIAPASPSKITRAKIRGVGILSDTPYAYLKIAEGCDRKCAYCVIPGIRGGFRSAPPEEIIKEAKRLVRAGAKELIVVAQDITSYGKDFGGYNLSRLLREIAAVRGDFRIRLLYLYPSSINEELIDTIASEEKICKYIDMPLQHSEEKMLRLMGRGGSRAHFKKLVSKLRKKIPGVSIRTTFIVGFPQETEEDFKGLMSFIEEVRFDRLGAFVYSKEEGTPAAGLKGQVAKKIKQERYERLMSAQAAISLEKNKELVGRRFRALVDETDGSVAIARTCSQAPEIDGVVIIESGKAKKGSFVEVEIIAAYDYDLKGIIA